MSRRCSIGWPPGAPGAEGLRASARAEAIAAHQRLEALAGAARETRERDLVMGQIGTLGLFGNVRQIYRLAVEKAKPDLERAPGFQQRDLPNIEGSQRQLERRYARSMEVQLMAYWLGVYTRLPTAQRLPALDAIVGDGSEAAIKRGLASLYAGTSLEATDARVALLGADQAALDAHADPLLKLAAALHPTYLTLENEVKSRSGDSLLHRPKFLAAVQAHRKSQGGMSTRTPTSACASLSAT